MCRFNVLLDRCYATTSAFPLNSTYFDLFVGWVLPQYPPMSLNWPGRSQGRPICLSLVSHRWQCLVIGVTTIYRQSWESMETPRRPASPSRLSASCRTATRRCRPITCTAPPDYARASSAVLYNRYIQWNDTADTAITFHSKHAVMTSKHQNISASN